MLGQLNVFDLYLVTGAIVVITKCFCFKLIVFGMTFISKEEKTFAIKEGRVPPYTNKDSQMHS